MIKRIAITGPESTGKSQLAEGLAARSGTVWVPEYAREYIDRLGRPYDEHDLLEIAKGQIKAERAMLKEARGVLFCDTELTVIRIWSEFKYGRCDPWIIGRQEAQHYDLYLLCDIDIPWKPDPQREHPLMRQRLFNLYEKEMQDRGWNYRVVQGTGSRRLEYALECLQELSVQG